MSFSPVSVSTVDSDASSTSHVHSSDMCRYDSPHASHMGSVLSDSNSNWTEDYSDLWLSDDDGCEAGSSVVNTNGTSLEQVDSKKCAVVLCNHNFRKQFGTPFFVCFPKNNLPLCGVWWKYCGRTDKFDISSKICSIHFNPADYKIVTGTHQIVLNTFNTVPTRYLLPHEFLMFSDKKRKNTVSDNNKIKINQCSVQCCNKTNLSSSKKTLFFGFPLQNKLLLEKWLKNINLSNWQPSETDKICSDHFENYFIRNIDGNCYTLDSYACPSLFPKKPFVMNSEGSDKISTNFKIKQVDDSFLNAHKKIENDKKTNNICENNQLQNEAISIILKSTEKECNEEKIGENENLNSDIHFEYVFLDVLNDEHVAETHPIIATNDELSKQNRVEYPPIKIKNDENSSSVVGKKLCISTSSLHTPTTSKKSQNSPIKEATETNEFERVPNSIMYTKELCEFYGEMLPPSCETDCQHFCFYTVPGPQRRCTFTEFFMLNDVTAQNCRIAELVQLRMVKKLDNTFDSYTSYYLLVNDRATKVCRLFFTSTLGIPDGRLEAVLNPINYSWYSDRETALRVNHQHAIKIVSDPPVVTDFMKASMAPFNQDYNVYEPKSNSEVSLDNVPSKVNHQHAIQIVSEPPVVTDFMKASMAPLNQDYNVYEPESDSEVSLDHIPPKVYEKVLLFMKSVPRVLSSYNANGSNLKFETTVCFENIYKMYLDDFIVQYGFPPPFTKRQFKKIYNQYMKPYLKTV